MGSAPSLTKGAPPFALAAALLALTVPAMSACATSPAETSAAGEAAAAASAGAGDAKGKAGEMPWWRKYIRPAEETVRPGEIPPGRPGLFSGKDGEFVLYRQGEADSSDPTKPSKVRR